MYRDALVYPDIFKAKQKGVISKYGDPKGWDDSSYVKSVWNLKHILNIGSGVQTNDNGLRVDFPVEYDTLD